MVKQRQDDQPEPIYNTVPIQDVAYQERWTIETSGGGGSGISVLAEWYNDDGHYNDDENIHIQKTEGIQTMSLFIFELFSYVKRFGVLD